MHAYSDIKVKASRAHNMQWLSSRDQKVKVHSSKAILEMNSTEVQNLSAS